MPCLSIPYFNYPCISFEKCLLIDQVSRHALIISSKYRATSVNLFIGTRLIIEKIEMNIQKDSTAHKCYRHVGIQFNKVKASPH